MPRRTYESDGHRVEVVEDLDDLVLDKREGWRATPAKARRRTLRYSTVPRHAHRVQYLYICTVLYQYSTYI